MRNIINLFPLRLLSAASQLHSVAVRVIEKYQVRVKKRANFFIIITTNGCERHPKSVRDRVANLLRELIMRALDRQKELALRRGNNWRY
jgi:hypothetical protein